MAVEQWRRAYGFPLYEVSDMGRVRRAETGRGTHAGRVLRPRSTRKGYIRVAVSDGTRGGHIDKSIQTLVLEAFVCPRPNDAQANHKDGNKTNNALSNLEWVTQSENQRHAIATGLRQSVKGEAAGRAKLTNAQVLAIRARKGQTQREIAAEFGVSSSLVGMIRLRQCWTHI